MATPLTADRFVAALKAEGVRVVERSGWKTRNRNHKGPWGGVNGVMVHHTGPYSTEKGMVDLCWSGYSGLPGPLCHGVVDRAGVVHLVGYGRANHAGNGDDDVLAAVVAETKLPVDNEANTDGNRHFYGFECINTGGGQSWPDAQVEGMVRIAAAICRAHGWSAASVIGHKEWQPGKPDPAGIDMNAFRARVDARLKAPAGSKDTPPEEDPLAGMSKADIAQAVWLTDGVTGVPEGWSSPGNDHWAPWSLQIDTGKRVRSIEQRLRAQQATIDNLVGAVAVLAANVGDLDPAAIVTELRESIESLTFRLDGTP